MADNRNWQHIKRLYFAALPVNISNLHVRFEISDSALAKKMRDYIKLESGEQ
jgi:hypothetical protein